MTKPNGPLTNWRFNVSEVSAGVYKVGAANARGPSFEMTGTEKADLLEKAKAAAQKMDQEIESKSSQR